MVLLGYETYNSTFYYYDFKEKKNISEKLNIQYIKAINYSEDDGDGKRYCSNLVDLIKNDSTNPFKRRLER
jgi:hypothetical protein